eukprot:UN27073
MEAMLTPSGMYAMNSVFQAILLNKLFKMYYQHGSVNIIMGDEMYCDTSRLLKYLRDKYQKFDLYDVNVTDSKSILDLFNGKCNKGFNVFFIEACTNPTGQIFDYSLKEQMKKLSEKLIFVVDNTWLTSAIFNPFEHGADIVLSSCSKYLST